MLNSVIYKTFQMGIPAGTDFECSQNGAGIKDSGCFLQNCLIE